MDRFKPRLDRPSQNPFAVIKARSVLGGFFAISIGLGTGLVVLGSLGILPFQVGDPIVAPLLYILVFVGLCLLVLAQGRSPALQLRDLLGPWPPSVAWLQVVWLVVGVFGFSLGAFQISYLGLSWIAPQRVEAALQQSLLLSADQTTIPTLYNVLLIVSVVVVAPVVEEFIFRGILLHRWGVKWGVRTAIVITSCLFGLLHSNLLGLFVFGVVMALLYLTTRSLLVPTVAHALNNALAMGLEYATTQNAPPGAIHTLAEFRSSWWLGVVCLGVSAPWLGRYIASHWPRSTTPLPYFVNQAQRLQPTLGQAGTNEE